MKAQSLIIQFILFFMIGLALFLTVGNVFRLQSNTIRKDIIEENLKLTSSFISSAAISAVDSCKECDSVSYKLRVSNKTADAFMELILSSSGLKISSSEGDEFSTSIHNLNSSGTLSGRAVSSQPITLTYYRTKNELRVY